MAADQAGPPQADVRARDAAAPDEAKKTTSTDKVSDTGKTLAGAVAIVIGAAGTFGTVTGGLAFLLRNHPWLLGSALGLGAIAAALATIAVLLPQKPLDEFTRRRLKLLAASAVLFAVALVLVVTSQAFLARNSARPVINAAMTSTTGGVSIKIDVDADALTVDDQLLISVGGVSPQGPYLTFYWGATGANHDGHARQSTTIPITLSDAIGTIDNLEVAASVVKKKDLGDLDVTDVFVTCDGQLFSARSGVAVRHLGHAACVTIKGFTAAGKATGSPPTTTEP